MPKNETSQGDWQCMAEKWEKVELFPHPKLFRETGATCRNSQTASLIEPMVMIPGYIHPVKKLVMWSDLPPQPLIPPANLLPPDNLMFPARDTRARSVLDLGDFFRHTETRNVHHRWSSLLGCSCRLLLSVSSFSHPRVNHGVFCACFWPRRPDSVKSGTIWSLILPHSTMDGISSVKSWLLSDSPLKLWNLNSIVSWKILWRAHQKNSQTKYSSPLFSWHTLLGRKICMLC